MTTRPSFLWHRCLWLVVTSLLVALLPLAGSFRPAAHNMLRYPALKAVGRQAVVTQTRSQSRLATFRAGSAHRRTRPHVVRICTTRLFSSVSTAPKPASSTQDDDEHEDVLTEIDISVEAKPKSMETSLNGQHQASSSSVEERLQAEGLKSRPAGNWNVDDPLGWTRNFGRRSPEYEARLQDLIRLGPGDEGYFDVDDLKVPGVTIVRTKEDAQKVVERLFAADRSIFHACDTEVMDIDLKSVGPVGNGYVTCASIYSGPDFDYGLGDGPGTRLWIDNLDSACGVLQEFKAWFESEDHLKVWHNYGFDRHVLWNEGIDCKGFGGDTMHMARLQDTSRSHSGRGGYSLETLTQELVNRRKKPMKEIFGVRRLRKDGSEGLLVDMPPVEEMQRNPKFRSKWIEYSCYDAEGTWLIRNELQKRLEAMKWFQDESGNVLNLYAYYQIHMRPFGEVLTDMERRGICVDAKEHLPKVELQAREERAHHLKVFREWAASQIGPDGLALNPASSVQLCTFLFGGAVNHRTKVPTESVRVFKVPREDIPEDALEAYRKRDEAEAKANGDPSDGEVDMLDMLEKMKVVQLKTLCKERGLKVSGKKAELQERLREHFLSSAQASPLTDNSLAGVEALSDEDLRDALIARGQDSSGSREELLARLKQDIEWTNEVTAVVKDGESLRTAMQLAAEGEGGAILEYLNELKEKSEEDPKFIDVTITSVGLTPEKFTTGGAPSVTADVLRKLAGDPFADPPIYGTALDAVGVEGCKALFSLCSIGSIDTMISSFICSLQELADHQDRVHCSLNLNTETGRLSSRRPNLQNQPALEKDKFKIRQAFQSSPGHNLIVADYGQLELRLLASLTDCKSMIEAFEAGGDFHSRTALDMFDYVRDKVDAGECLLEWDYSKGDPPKPLLKDMFASERRKAKTLNFSIAYGKTAHGLSQDWGVSPKEAEQMLQAWYEARPEVREWQKATKQHARDNGETRTLMGRYRQLPEAKSNNRKFVGHAERASINTPIQGGAADVAMMAMNKINNSKKLRKLGWVLLLQIHDEVILEGPEETAEEAFEEVIECMQSPWVIGLKPTAVPLLVDGSYEHKNWYDAK